MPEHDPDSLPELADWCDQLAARIRYDWQDKLSGYIRKSIRDLIYRLEKTTPGLERPFDMTMVTYRLSHGHYALKLGRPVQATVHALHGLKGQPHNPDLFYLFGSALFELGEVELAMRALCHVLWINPGNKAARADLEALSAFLDDQEK